MATRFRSEDTTLDGEVHFLEKPDSYVSRVLCYPREACDVLAHRVRTLLEDGFVYLVETGTRVFNMRILGKGYTGVTTVAYHRVYGTGALKVLRLDSRRGSLEREAEILARVQDTGVAPKLYLYRDFYVFREYIPVTTCTPISKYITRLLVSRRLEDLRETVYEVLRAFYELDTRGVDHTEVGRPGGHVFYCESGVRVLDWDSARISSKPSNLTSFTSYLIYRFEHSSELRTALGYNPHEVLNALKNYKRLYTAEAFNQVLTALKLVQ